MKNFSLLLFLMVCQFMAFGQLYSQWINTNLPDTGSGSEEVYCFAVAPDGTGGASLFVGTAGGVYHSGDNGASWTKVSGIGVYALALFGSNLYGGTNTMTYGGIICSADHGASWYSLGLPYLSINAFANINPYFFAATSGGGVYVSVDNGTHWTETDTTGLISRPVGALAVTPNETSGAYLFAGTTGKGIFRTTDYGQQWIPMSNGLTDLKVMELLAHGATLFAATYSKGVFRSTDDGATWGSVNTGLTNYNVGAFALSGERLFAGGGGVYTSTNDGENWVEVSEGLTDMYSRNVNALVIMGTTLFAGTMDGVWKRPLSEMLTSVSSASVMPSHFNLEQNYPNPFNPSTTIQFSLPKATYVTLSIYNVLGQKVAMLVSQQMNAGTHTAKWNPIGFSSGIYYYRLKAGSFHETQKLVLLK